MIIDCSQCEMQATENCKDCLVMAVLNRHEDGPLVIDAEQEPAIVSLQQAGLAPILRFERKAG